MELCSACIMRDADPEVGFCLQCTRARVVEHYAEEEGERARARASDWKARSLRRTVEDREHDRLRQQRHREMEKLRPHEPAPSFDPAVIALEGLHHLATLRPAAKTAQALGHLERVEEVVKRLGWGPGD